MSSQTVKVLRSGKWAINPPNKGEVIIKKGETRNDLPNQLIKRMLNADTPGWIEVVKGNGKENPSDSHVLDDVSEIRATLMEMIEGADNKNDAKDLLETWGKENLNFDIDKRRSLENVLADFITEYEAQNG